MKLDVPLVTQGKGSVDCGLASAAMVFQYYGDDISLSTLKKKLPVDEIGTYNPQIGTFFLENGYTAEIITQHPGLFVLKDRGKTHEQILSHLEKMLRETKKDQDKKVLEYFIEFLKNGGTIRVEVPDTNHVIESINDNQPIIPILTTRFLIASSGNQKFNFHSNVITGIDEEYVYVNDPAYGEYGGKLKHKISDYFYGFYAAAYGDLDNSSFLRVKPGS